MRGDRHAFRGNLDPQFDFQNKRYEGGDLPILFNFIWFRISNVIGGGGGKYLNHLSPFLSLILDTYKKIEKREKWRKP